MSDYVTQDIWIEILTRLPVKSILRSTVVCKSWYSLIRSPNFISIHSRKKQCKNTILLLRLYDKNDSKEHYTLHHDDYTFRDQICELEFPFKSSVGFFRIVGSCNGLICLSDDLLTDTKTIILWNPSIREWVNLPRPYRPPFPHMSVLGYGFDSIANDFKVVSLVYSKQFPYRYNLPPDVEVYSLREGCWRRVCSEFPPYYLVEFMWSQAFLKGKVHWIAYDKCLTVDRSCSILLFDMSAEVFSVMMLPDDLAGQLPMDLSITLLGECLSVIKDDRRIGSTTYCVWVMKEYGVAESWTKLFTVDLQGMCERTVGFRKNGEILLSQKIGELVSYDVNTSKVEDLGIVGSTRSFYVDDYVESLILLPGWDGDASDRRQVNEVDDDQQ